MKEIGERLNRPTEEASQIAGILSDDGGFRVVVAVPHTFKHHLSKSEQIFIVPDMIVWEPIPWDDIPAVIAEAVAATKRGTNRPIKGIP